MRVKIVGALLVACAAAAAIAVPAGAVVVETANGPVGYLPPNGQGPGSSGPGGATVPTGEPPLEYHGGPVMHSQKAYAIFWAPSGHSFPPGYEAAIETYFQNVAADSGRPSNVYSVGAQYTDGSGHASYSDTFGGSITDTNAYPTSGACAPYEGFTGIEYNACVSDEQIKEEVETDVAGHGWPKGLGSEYYVVLPPEVGSCFEGGPEPVCFDVNNKDEQGFCAYHGDTEPSAGVFEVYANISFSAGDAAACGVEEYPNGHSNGNVDDTLSVLSHEANESITDPTLDAWFDENRLEDGDECRNTPFGEDYGEPLGGSAGSLFNEEIGTGHYYLQQEWSNDIEDCAQRVEPASPAISAPPSVVAGEAASFNGLDSVAGSGPIASYSWDFGDGHTASGVSVSHAFTSAGTFAVTLTVKDDGGFSYSTTQQVTVASPATPVPPVGPQPPPPHRKSLKCRKGFRRTHRHGKAVCIKVKRHRHRHH